jgi:dTDP-4-amino-4,6-dideoxygalactose transaminase
MVEKLAIDGGPRTVPEGIIKPWPWITDEERQAVLDVISDPGGWLPAPYGPRPDPRELLEKEWADYVGAKYCVSASSGTSALHLAVAAAGVGPGSEVIVPAFTFLSSASCILHQNGIPVFVDIDPRTYNLDPNKIEEKITKRTKAIMAVHLHGLPADMDEINAIAKRHNLVVIGDNAQSQGALYKGRKVDALSDISACSIIVGKNLSCGTEGGLFVTNNEEFYERAKRMREFGEVIRPGERRVYNALGMGWNYRMTFFAAAFARCQLRKLDMLNELRRKNCEYLSKHLGEIDGIEPPYVPPDRTHVYFFYVLRLKMARLGIKIPEERDELGLNPHAARFRTAFERALNAEGVPIGQWQTVPVPSQSVFQFKDGYGLGCPWSCPFYTGRIEPFYTPVKYRNEDYPETLKLIDEYLMISRITPPNDIELMKLYVEAFRKVFDNINRIKEISKTVELPWPFTRRQA